ncbi:MAG: phosphate ABC transporter substrate-binding protein PstS family protein [Desulfarculaceae bacterium]|nr:phosphate ABC transporter substrate-binding protein PstS family protein [Desulfarculaceae bacterium]
MGKLKQVAIIGICMFLVFTARPGSAAESLMIRGSTTVYPVAEESARSFMKMNPEINIQVRGTGSGDGIAALINGDTDIATSSRWIKDEEIKMALEKGILPVPFQVAYDCIIPVVHPSNTLKNISMENLKKIYSGQITNWSQLGRQNRPIKVYSRDTSSGTYGVWKKRVMKGAPFSPGLNLTEGNTEMKEAVANDKNAIGYIGMGYLNSSVRALAIDGVQGSLETALNGSYPVARPLFMLTKGWPEGRIKRFISFVMEPNLGQRVVKRVGYLELYSSKHILPAPEPEPCVSGKNVAKATVNSSKMDKPALTLYKNYKEMNWNGKVERLQRNLHKLGYKVGPIDGLWGPKTLQAYNSFLEDNNRKTDGIVTYERLQLMELNLNQALFNKLST